jgi:biopolymer transport protein ExbB/TolQ
MIIIIQFLFKTIMFEVLLLISVVVNLILMVKYLELYYENDYLRKQINKGDDLVHIFNALNIHTAKIEKMFNEKIVRKTASFN